MRSDRSLRNSRDFRRVYAEGRAARRDDLGVYVVARRDSAPTRLGLTVRVSPDGAVARNRARRRLRAAFRVRGAPPGYDVVIRGDRGVLGADFQELADNLDAALRSAGMREGS